MKGARVFLQARLWAWGSRQGWTLMPLGARWRILKDGIVWVGTPGGVRQVCTQRQSTVAE